MPADARQPGSCRHASSRRPSWPCPPTQHHATNRGHATRHSAFARAFTLVELLVAAGIMAVMIVGIASVFQTTTDAIGITEADIQILGNWRVLDSALREDVANHMSTGAGLIIIHSEFGIPAPPGVASAGPSREARPGGVAAGVPRLTRIDRLAFTARGHYDSVTGDIAGSNGEPVTSDAALLFYGHGVSASLDITTPPPPWRGVVTADYRAEWLLSRRAILFGVSVKPADATWRIDLPPLDLKPKPGQNLATSHPSIYQSGVDGVQATFPQFLNSLDMGPNRETFIGRTLVPQGVTAATHRRAMAAMLYNVGDFIVEWTDGSFVDPFIDPDTGQPFNSRVQWFGFPRDSDFSDPNHVPEPFKGDTMTKVDWLREVIDALNAQPTLVTAGSNDHQVALDAYLGTFSGRPIEEIPPGANRPYIPTGSPNDFYHAAWFSVKSPQSDYRFRPTAFRIIVRLYDPTLRIRASSRDSDPPRNSSGNPLYSATDHYGSEFTIVVP